MQNRRVFLIPLIFVAVLIPVMVAALLIFRPGDEGDDCNCGAVPAFASHTHGMALARVTRDRMLILFNVAPAAELYTVADGRLERVSGADPATKHVTIDVLDTDLAPGERLPVKVALVVRDAATGETVIDDAMPAMYAPGHGYHFGDNYALPPAARYDWRVTISPVAALRLEGTQDRWLEPVEWDGSFSLDADGNVEDRPMAMQKIGEFSKQGLHVVLNVHHAEALYEVRDGIAQAIAPGAHMAEHAGAAAPDHTRYFSVDVTDHAVNYEEKLLGAAVTLTFTQGDTSFEVALQPAVSPVMGFHYGANVELGPGEWTIKASVSQLDFQRHAGAAVSLPLGTVSGDFAYVMED